jgi:hypothetical protein
VLFSDCYRTFECAYRFIVPPILELNTAKGYETPRSKLRGQIFAFKQTAR